jgi:putative transposase
MPRVARIVIPSLPHHITQRGSYRQKIFFRSEDYRLYLSLLAEYARLGYCLMPNHVHLILVPRDAEALGRLFHRLHGDYARAIHVRLRRKGHLFQARYQSVPMDEEHFWAAMVNVEENPQRARLARRRTCGTDLRAFWTWCGGGDGTRRRAGSPHWSWV